MQLIVTLSTLAALWLALPAGPVLADEPEATTERSVGRLSLASTAATSLTLDDLAGDEWIVTQIGGQPVVDGSEVTMQFDGAGAVAGRASCNRYRANVEMTATGLLIGPAGATMMACPEPVLAQERRFLALLEESLVPALGDDGHLVLSTKDGPMIVAERRG